MKVLPVGSFSYSSVVNIKPNGVTLHPKDAMVGVSLCQ